jgi:hypothetical protein
MGDTAGDLPIRTRTGVLGLVGSTSLRAMPPTGFSSLSLSRIVGLPTALKFISEVDSFQDDSMDVRA